MYVLATKWYHQPQINQIFENTHRLQYLWKECISTNLSRWFQLIKRIIVPLTSVCNLHVCNLFLFGQVHDFNEDIHNGSPDINYFEDFPHQFIFSLIYSTHISLDFYIVLWRYLGTNSNNSTIRENPTGYQKS